MLWSPPILLSSVSTISKIKCIHPYIILYIFKIYLDTVKTLVTRMVSDTMEKKTDLHVCRLGVGGGHQAVVKPFKVAKGTRCSGIVGKAISQLCPTVTKTSF